MAKNESEPDIVKTTIRVPRELWKRLRIRAVEEDTSGEELVAKALAAYLDGKLAKKGGGR